MNLLSKIKRLSSAANRRVTNYQTELDRILSLPIREPTDIKAIEEDFIKAHAYDDGFRFFKPQAEALDVYRQTNKLLGSIGVGWGKTLITLLVAQIAYKEKGYKKIVLMIPPTLFPQLINKDLPWARRRVYFTVPVYGITGDKYQRLAKSSTELPGLYVIPYSIMSTVNGEDCLRAIDPQLIIADEAHNLKNLNAAKTKRTLHVIKDTECDLVALSGTITSKSIRDFAHLMMISLREKSPIPNYFQGYSMWSQVMDSGVWATFRQLQMVSKLIYWAGEKFPEEEFSIDSSGFRTAFRCRFESSPGVVSTGDADIRTGLTICTAPKEGIKTCVDPETFKQLEKYMKGVEDEWVTPNGDEISYALHKFKWRYELSAGFYNELIWPTAEEIQKSHKISFGNAESVLRKSKEYHKADQAYHKEVRLFLSRGHRSSLDTPELIGTSIRNHKAKHVGQVLYGSWLDRDELDFEDRVERYAIAKRICDYKIRCAKDWAEHIERGIIWFYNREIGAWLNEQLEEFNPLYCPSGQEYNTKIIDTGNKNRIIIASIMAHSTGKNLQHHQNQLFVQWPRVASIAEQTLGRVHRNGQTAEELYVDTLFYTAFDFECFSATLQDSLYIHQSTGSRQKLVYCHYEPFPETYPNDFLRERGFDVKRLDRKMRRELEERFGGAT